MTTAPFINNIHIFIIIFCKIFNNIITILKCSMSQVIQDGNKDEEGEFLSEEVYDMAVGIIEKVLGENSYSELRVNSWCTTIIERLLTDLAKLKRPFKYIVTCSLQQRVGAGFHVSSASFWEPNVDGCCTVKWNNDYIHCCLHVFGVQI